MDLKEIRVNKRKTRILFSIKKPKDKKNLKQYSSKPPDRKKKKKFVIFKNKKPKKQKRRKKKSKEKDIFATKSKDKAYNRGTVLKRKKTNLKRKRKNSLTLKKSG